ncbi:MAG: hypothetical protein AAGF83_10045 [Cyanobacteria bacterium P01_G01_bin.67]
MSTLSIQDLPYLTELDNHEVSISGASGYGSYKFDYGKYYGKYYGKHYGRYYGKHYGKYGKKYHY